jgi:hypothetical protein
MKDINAKGEAGSSHTSISNYCKHEITSFFSIAGGRFGIAGTLSMNYK